MITLRPSLWMRMKSGRLRMRSALGNRLPRSDGVVSDDKSSGTRADAAPSYFEATLTVSRLRPLRRRLFRTRRPPRVAMRARKPWVRLRRML